MPIIRVGINSASTFPGFCRDHDRKLFAPTERRPLLIGDKEQALSLLLRAATHEYAQQRYVQTFAECMIRETDREFNPFVSAEQFQNQIDTIDDWNEEFGKPYVDRIFSILNSRTYDEFNLFWKVVPHNIDVSCCALYTPNTMSVSASGAAVGFHVMPRAKETHIVAVWFKKDQLSVGRYFEDNANSQQLERLINHGAFLGSEDTCISPRIWERLTSGQQTEIALAMRHPYFRHPLTPAPQVIKLSTLNGTTE